MPFPANWLEELVIEWLDLAKFAISTSIILPAGPGGPWSRAVAGTKMDAGRLVILPALLGPAAECAGGTGRTSQP